MTEDLKPDFKFPEENVLDLTVFQFGKPIKLKSYRYPVPVGKQRRGVIFYIHGYGAYANRDAGIAKELAEKGNFEVFAIDQRGFGESEGMRAIVEKTEDIYND